MTARRLPTDGEIGASGDACPRLLTVREVAAWLQLTEKGVYAMVEARRIPFVKVSNRVRFICADVVQWLRENRVPALEKNR